MWDTTMEITFNFRTSGNTKETVYIDLLSQIADLLESHRDRDLTYQSKQRIYQYAKIRFDKDVIPNPYDE